MQFQVNSLQGLVHGIRDFAAGRPGIKHCLATKCECIVNSIHYRMGSLDLVLASGRPGSTHGLALKCTHGSDSTVYAVFRSTQCSLLLVIVSWFGSSPHGKAVTWLTNCHQASQGAHNPQLFNSIWFNSLGKCCSKI